MATETQLAVAFAEFSTKGLDKVLGEAKAIGKGMDAAAASMTKAEKAATAFASRVASAFAAPGRMVASLGKGIDDMAAKMSSSGIGKLSKLLSFGGGLGVGGLMAGASQDTVEADALSHAVERLTRIVGSAFAPYMRMATAALNEAANWFGQLDAATTASIAKWAMIVTGVAGFVALLPVAIGFIGTLVGAFATLMSPIGLVVAGLALAGAAFAGFFDDSVANSESSSEAIEGSQKGWIETVTEYMGKLVVSFGKGWNQIMDWAGKAANFFKNVWAKAVDGIATGLASLGESIGMLPEGTVASLAEDIERERKRAEKNPIDLSSWKINVDALGERVAGLGAEFESRASDLTAAFGRIGNAGGEGGFAKKMPSKFEGGDDTWQRIQLGLINSTDNPAKATAKSAADIASNTSSMAASMSTMARDWPPVR